MDKKKRRYLYSTSFAPVRISLPWLEGMKPCGDGELYTELEEAEDMLYDGDPFDPELQSRVCWVLRALSKSLSAA